MALLASISADGGDNGAAEAGESNEINTRETGGAAGGTTAAADEMSSCSTDGFCGIRRARGQDSAAVGATRVGAALAEFSPPPNSVFAAVTAAIVGVVGWVFNCFVGDKGLSGRRL